MTISVILAGRDGAVVSAEPDTTVGAAVALLADRRIGALPVVDGDTVVGIFSERDVIHAVAKHGAAALDRPVSELMTAPPVTVAPDEDALSALGLMTRRRIRHLPVLADGTMVGFVSIGDLVKFRIDRIEREANALRDYIQSA
ncbi:CBS domain-containing protein [Sphingomonas flavalba]|uniref:CBS domain-containing protein n=1 Tax=Sphingomonas flavalba TaxID=2559804 RepID=UPI00109D8839|nr:CBS domain-containing protein [Sphingomonas flavalba]